MPLFSFFRKQPKKPKQPETRPVLSPEEFLATDYIQGLLKKYKRPATLFRAHRSEVPIGQDKSKFGGVPSFVGFEIYPCCDGCGTPLNFVLQLYKKDFPDFYFPENVDLFQLFRCPNYQCPGAFEGGTDLKMFHYYFNTENSIEKQLSKPTFHLEDAEAEVPDCYLKPEVIQDMPMYDDYEENDFYQIDDLFGDELSELFSEKYITRQNSKFGGYPSFTQSALYPVCTCDKTKEFFFQLSSEDVEDGIPNPPPAAKWSAHGIMIGDLGNIYYYFCKSCGPESIESSWDCY